MKTKDILLTVSAMLAVQGCAHGRLEKQVDDKVAQEAQVKSRADVGEETKQTIEHASGLTQEQRFQLLALRDYTHTQLDALTNQSLRLRAVLVKELVSTDYDEDEVQLIKNRIREVEDKKVSMIFDAADKADRILGRDTAIKRKVLDDFFEPHEHYH